MAKLREFDHFLSSIKPQDKKETIKKVNNNSLFDNPTINMTYQN